LSQTAINVGFDLWRAVSVAYASAYLRRGSADMPCGYSYARLGPDGVPVAASAAERNAWWSTASGIPPQAEIALVDSLGAGAAEDPAFAGLRCLRALWTERGSEHDALRAAVAATQAQALVRDVPLLLIHGSSDGLIPPALSTDRYVQALRERGGTPALWHVAGAQHFDAFLAFPGMADRHVGLWTSVMQGLDAVTARLDGELAKIDDR
jgi:hydroxybutyrate-dimer hydrolase